jgi:hypothetical protein
MWCIVKTWPVRGSGKGPAQPPAGHRHRGFSHPARFEALEERLALNVAPAAPTVAPSLASQVSGVAGDPGSAPGTNPASFSPANTTGSIALVEGNVLENQEVAFNTPYWVPNDRPPFTSPTSDQLPANVNQEANTPYGIRNFNLGPNTSPHFTTPGVTLTVRWPTNGNADGNRVVNGSLDDASLVDAVLGAEVPISQHKEAAAGQPDGTAWSATDGGPARLSQLRPEDPSPKSEIVFELPDPTGQPRPEDLEARAVDRMMSDESEADTAGVDAAILQVVAGDPAETQPGPAPSACALAASLSLAASVAIREHAWDKTEAHHHRRARHTPRW